jgi:hypothetical protein
MKIVNHGKAHNSEETLTEAKSLIKLKSPLYVIQYYDYFNLETCEFFVAENFDQVILSFTNTNFLT